MVPVLRRITIAASLLCALSACAQENIPRPIPPMEEEAPRRAEPQVAYADGKLRIVASDSTLGDVLDAVRTRTGAVITAPPAVAAQRISLKAGPAPLFNVVTKLLEQADCNYVVVGSAAEPSEVRIAVASKPSEAELLSFVPSADQALEAAREAVEAVDQALQAPGEAPKSGENVPDSAIVTVPESTNKAELGASISATEKPSPEPENGNQQQRTAAPK